jgi:hypothetical protein
MPATPGSALAETEIWIEVDRHLFGDAEEPLPPQMSREVLMGQAVLVPEQLKGNHRYTPSSIDEDRPAPAWAGEGRTGRHSIPKEDDQTDDDVEGPRGTTATFNSERQNEILPSITHV